MILIVFLPDMMLCWVHMKTVFEICQLKRFWYSMCSDIKNKMYWKYVSHSYNTVMYFWSWIVLKMYKGVFDKLFKLKRFLYTPEIWWCVNIQYIFETISIHFQNVLKVCLNSSKFHCIESHNKLSFVSMFAKSFISETNTINLTIVH